MQKLNQKGSIIIYASAVLLVMLASASAFALVGLNQVRQARQTDQSLSAFYAAESAVERSLEQLKYVKNEQPDILNLSTPTDFGPPPVHNLVWADGFLTAFNTASSARLVPEGLSVLVPKIIMAELLLANTSVQVDLFDPLMDGAGTAQKVGSIGYRWDMQGIDPEYVFVSLADILNLEINQSESIEYSTSGAWACLAMRGGLFTSAQMDAFFGVGAEYLPESDPTAFDLRQYRVKITALNNDLNNFEFVVSKQTCAENNNFTGPSSPSETDLNLHSLGGVLDIRARAQSGGTTQALRSVISIAKATSGLWDFTVFTNEPLEK